jgi:hypothetical protein
MSVDENVFFREATLYLDYIDKLQEAGLGVIDLKGSDMKQAAHIAKENGLITADLHILPSFPENPFRI